MMEFYIEDHTNATYSVEDWGDIEHIESVMAQKDEQIELLKKDLEETKETLFRWQRNYSKLEKERERYFVIAGILLGLILGYIAN